MTTSHRHKRHYLETLLENAYQEKREAAIWEEVDLANNTIIGLQQAYRNLTGRYYTSKEKREEKKYTRSTDEPNSSV